MTSFDADISLPIAPDGAFSIDAVMNRFTHFGVELGLERIQRLLAALGNPQQQVPILHVAGSNGKGSVCAYLAAVLQQAGYRVGRYTSPHLVSWCERIWINGNVEPEVLYALLQDVVAAIAPDYPSPTQFEVITAAAWLYFARQQVDIAVMEVGLGGRLDATNVCDRPLVSVITSLSREHWQRLGPTLADIAREKAGILKEGCPAAIAPQPPEAEAVLKQRIAELHCPAVWVTPAVDLGNGQAEYRGWEPEGRLAASVPSVPSVPSVLLDPVALPVALPISLKYALPLLGAHQLINSAVAIAALHLLRAQGWVITDDAIASGIAKTQWRGRMQWISWNGHRLLVDGAHNPAGAAMLRQYIDQDLVNDLIDNVDIDNVDINNVDKNSIENTGKTITTLATRVDSSPHPTLPISWVMGMIANKDHADVFRELLRTGDRLYLVPVPDHLSADLAMLAALATEVCPGIETYLTTDVVSALEQAFQVPDQPAATVLCGSLYLIGHFFKEITSSKETNVNR